MPASRVLESAALSDTLDTHQILAAILAADAAGYSRLMATDERSTLAALDASREVFRAQIKAHQGRVVDTAGDSILALFESAAGAVNAALAVQAELQARLAQVPVDRRLQFRIGVHLGDVIEKADGSVYGDGVNTAARLEGLASPGGITVSDAVQGAVRNGVNATFEDMGKQQLKNIANPVRAFRVLPHSGNEGATPGTQLHVSRAQQVLRWRGLPAVVLAAVAVVVLGAMALVVHLGDRHGPRAAPLLSLAVLPFKATGAAATDPSTDTFTREITAALGQSILGSSIIANSAVAPYRGTLTDVRAVGKSLNVRYVLEGDIAHEGGEVVVGLVLVDALTAKQVWSERIRTPAAKVGVWPELPVLKAAKAVHLALWDVEQRRLAMQPLDEANPLEMVFHAWMIDTSTRKGLEKFNGLCEEALRLDPNLPAALTCKASAIFAEMALDTASSHPKLENELDDLSQRAIATSSSDAMVWRLRSNVLRMQHQWAAAFEANARAIQLDPEFAVDLYTRADYLVLTGQPEEALPLLMRAADISPTQVSLFQRVACHAYLSMGRFGDAINSCERSVTSTEPWNVSVDLAVAYANQGDAAKAAAAKVRVLARKPEFNMAWYRAWGMRQTDNKVYWEQYDNFIVPGLRQAGFAEK